VGAPGTAHTLYDTLVTFPHAMGIFHACFIPESTTDVMTSLANCLSDVPMVCGQQMALIFQRPGF
jgi:hypothetical protein